MLQILTTLLLIIKTDFDNVNVLITSLTSCALTEMTRKRKLLTPKKYSWIPRKRIKPHHVEYLPCRPPTESDTYSASENEFDVTIQYSNSDTDKCKLTIPFSHPDTQTTKCQNQLQLCCKSQFHHHVCGMHP